MEFLNLVPDQVCMKKIWYVLTFKFTSWHMLLADLAKLNESNI